MTQKYVFPYRPTLIQCKTVLTKAFGLMEHGHGKTVGTHGEHLSSIFRETTGVVGKHSWYDINKTRLEGSDRRGDK